MFDKKIYIFIAFLVLLRFISGEFKVKGSIAFVIDNTDSMESEIEQVKEKTSDIFDAVFNSNASQIDQFIIVTFNDPGREGRTGAKLRANTNRYSKFRTALSLIRPFGGYDCPEMAMAGIELALDESKPNSFLYVFTDASAKDYEKYENVKSLALEKSIQINFLLTGTCNDTNEEQHAVYYRLAAATTGQVLHIDELEISKIIKYVLANLGNKRTILLHKINGCDEFKFTVDSKVWDIYVALSARRPIGSNDFMVLGPDRNRASTLDFISSKNTTIVQLKGKPGEYSIYIRNCEITVVVNAATSVSFRHGFSPVRPSSFNETSTKPLNGKESYLAIALDDDNRDVTLKTVEIRDMDDKLVQQLLLKLVDEENQFYITDLFTPPEKTFKVAINGYTKLNEKITRVSQTSIEYHSPEKIGDKKRKATVTVIGPKEVLAEYNEPLMLKCKVTGFPKPDIWWLDEFDNVVAAEEQKISPYEYISVVYIDEVTMNKTLTCFIQQAKNFVRRSDDVSVIVGKRSFFHVLEYPTDVTVEYGKPAELNFKINAKPSATIIWYQDNKIIKNSEDITISSDGSSFNINSAKLSLEGKYYVTASNGYVEKKYEFTITVTIKERPAAVTILGLKEIIAEYDQPLSVKCKVEGFPKPNITWEDEFHRGFPSKIDEITPYKYLNTLYIDKVTENVTYICKANNTLNQDSDSIQVITKKKSFFNISEYPKDVAVEYNKSVELNLKIDAMPPATIIWFQVDKEIQNNHDFHISADGSLLKIKNAQPRLEGKYYVKATNGDKKVKYEFYVSVIGTEVPRIDKHVNSYKTLKKSSVDIKCRVMQGTPEPTISWSFDYNSLGKFINLKETAETIHIENVTANDIGTYRCNVSNVVGSDHHEMELYMEGSIKIETPKQTTFDVELESPLVLPCHVTGYPKPKVVWLQYPTGPATAPKKIESDKDNNVILKNIQYEHEGRYMCRAINHIDRVEINYIVNIQDPTVRNNVQLIEGDLRFSLSCINRRRPKTTVTWTINGTEVGRGEGFDISRDGNLTASNVTMKHKGTYICKAENGSYRMEYEVDVLKFPPIEEYSRIIPVTEGKKVHSIFCDVKVNEGDLARWFKDGKLVKTGGIFTFMNVTKADAGYYTCRYNPSQGASSSFHNRVIVGTKPKFVTEANSTVTFKAGAQAHLDCNATGKPPPIIKWWYGMNQTCINATQCTITMNITQNTELSYTCTVSNDFDTIKREFKIIPDECLMDLKKDFTAQQPLLVFGKRKRLCPVFDVSDGSLRMHKHEKFKFFCPNSFISYNHSNFGISLETSCLGDSMFDLSGRTVKASEITCNTAIIPTAEDLTNKCLGSEAELNIGFKIDGSPVCTAFSVCFNAKTKTPIFAKHTMHKSIANTIPVHVAGYTRGTRMSFEFEDIYDCRNQVEAISSFTGKPLKTVEDEKCCFKKRQLVNPKDVLPGISQVATYHYLNVVPQWSTCGTENWDEVERRVRLYALNLEVRTRTMIWTGATSVMKNVAPIILKDKQNQTLQVSQFIWKVVEKQLAIVHINVPGLTSAQEASSYILCRDICELIDWMRNRDWHDVDKGFIYCCTIKEFEQAFHYEDAFAKRVSRT